MRKIAIIGLGNVGSTLAFTLIERKLVDELALFDIKENLLVAEENDLTDAQVNRDTAITITRNNLSSLANVDICVFAAGDINALKGQDNRFAELNFTKQIAQDWALQLKEFNFNGILLNITNPCDVITRYLQEKTQLPRNRVFGTGTSLDTARMKHATSNYLNIHTDCIEGLVLGEHGETQFIPWSLVRIGFSPAENSLSISDCEAIEKAARYGGWKTINGKGYTNYGIANQAAQIIQSLLTDSQKIFPLSVYHEIEKLYIGYPAKIGKDGVSQVFPPQLTNAEQQKWQASVKWLNEMYQNI